MQSLIHLGKAEVPVSYCNSYYSQVSGVN